MKKRRRNVRQLDMFEQEIADVIARARERVIAEAKKREPTSRSPAKRKGTIRKRPVTVREHVRWIRKRTA